MVSVVTASTLLVVVVRAAQEGEGVEGGLVPGVAWLGRGISPSSWIFGELNDHLSMKSQESFRRGVFG